MPQQLKWYIGMVSVTGCLLLILSVPQWNAEPVRWLSCLAIASVASTLKIRLPGMPSSISANFVILLASLRAFDLGPAVCLAAAATLVQLLWKPRSKPVPVRIVFSVSAIVISLSVAHAVVNQTRLAEIPGLVLAATAFFLSTTLLVCPVFSTLKNEPLIQIWRRCHLWAAPYYLVGSVVAGLVVVSEQLYGWQQSILVYPILFLIYSYFEALMTARRSLGAARMGAGSQVPSADGHMPIPRAS